MVVARLDTIRRQRDPELREAVTRAANGEIAESLAILHRRGDIREVGNFDERHLESHKITPPVRNQGSASSSSVPQMKSAGS